MLVETTPTDHRIVAEARDMPRTLRTLVELNRDNIATRIRERMAELRVTQDELAEILEVHRNTIGNWTRRHEPITPWDRLGEIAGALGTTKEWLLHGEQPLPQRDELRSEVEALRQMVSDLTELVAERLPPPPKRRGRGSSQQG